MKYVPTVLAQRRPLRKEQLTLCPLAIPTDLPAFVPSEIQSTHSRLPHSRTNPFTAIDPCLRACDNEAIYVQHIRPYDDAHSTQERLGPPSFQFHRQRRGVPTSLVKAVAMFAAVVGEETVEHTKTVPVAPGERLRIANKATFAAEKDARAGSGQNPRPDVVDRLD